MTGRAARSVDDFLRGRGRFAVGAPPSGRTRSLLAFIVVCSAFYGMVMASFGALAPGRLHNMAYVAVKMPLLILGTTAICLPSYFVVNAVAGLRDDFAEAFHAILATQACVTVGLASLAPVTAFFYYCSRDYSNAVLFNADMFTVAALGAQVVMRRYYAPLIGRAPAHRRMLWFWFLLYAFVGIQMGWLLRPFIGDPRVPVEFFRSDFWGNAYVVIIRLVRRFVTGPWG
jgi:hypothetical protein